MQVKLLQLNIQAGRELTRIIEFIKKEDFDILHFQEVSGGKFSRSVVDNFKTICDELGFFGEIVPYVTLKHDETAYFGNATFYNKSFHFNDKKVVWLKPFIERIDYVISEETIRNISRNVLGLRFVINGSPLWFINTHLAWGPTPEDEPYKIKQAEKLYAFLKTLQDPFILSGDFNVTPSSQIVKRIEELAVNHITKNGFTNTLNPRLHRVSSLFPNGLAVDYIFTDRRIVVKEVKLIDTPDLSDHFGLSLTIEV